MSIIALKPPTERKPGPYPAGRTCPDCKANLSRNNPGPLCAQCNGGDWGDSSAEVERRRAA